MTDAPLLDVITMLLRSAQRSVQNGWPSSPGNEEFVLLSYRRDFRILWGLIDAATTDQEAILATLSRSAPNAARRDINLVLLWDGDVPTAGMEQDWLTAYDWLVAFGEVASQFPPPIRVFLIDLAPSRPRSFSENTFRQNPGLVPWARVYRPIVGNDIPRKALSKVLGTSSSRVVAQNLDLSQLLDDLVGVGCDVPTIADSNRDLDAGAPLILRDLWANKLAGVGDHHSISNLIAPLILVRELENCKSDEASQRPALRSGSPTLEHFESLLRALNLLPPRQKQSTPITSPLTEEFVQVDIFGQFSDVRFLLVDDDADRGYAEIISNLVSAHGQKKASITSTTKPDVLAEWLEAPGAGEQFRLIGADRANLESFDVLILDLRLFDEAAETGRANLLQFLNRLIEFYERRPSLWKHEQLAKAVEAARRRRESVGAAPAFQHLLLLPLLLSVVDPSLPIILFTSSRQRDIVDQLAHAQNIVMAFAKPAVNGYVERNIRPNEHIGQLRRAVLEALVRHESRVIWRRLFNLKSGPPPVIGFACSGDVIPKDLQGKETEFGSRMYLYNTEAGRVEHHPWPDNKKIRTSLARHYLDYILTERFHEFSSVPSEFLEGICTPKKKLSNTYWKSVQVKLHAEYKGCSNVSRRNFLAEGLYVCRNRKVHGYGLGSSLQANLATSSATDSANRTAAILQFLTLLDYIEGKYCAEGPGPPELFEICCRLVAKFYAISWWPKSKRIQRGQDKRWIFHASELVSMTAIDWADFVLFALRSKECEAQACFQPETRAALDRFARQRWTRELGKVFQPPTASNGLIARESQIGFVSVDASVVRTAGKNLALGDRVSFNLKSDSAIDIEFVKAPWI